MGDPIEKLRECWLVNPVSGLKPFDYEIGDVLADEIEAAYMKSPVDADGVPIRPGDTVECDTFGGGECAVLAVARDFWVDIDGFTHKPEGTHHVKHYTVEDIIAEAMSFACEPESPYSVNSKYVREYAKRIRKAVEHNARDH